MTAPGTTTPRSVPSTSKEALDAAFLLAEGATPARIRAAIDERYTGLAPPTDTPLLTG
ncbi:MAG: hypothetical protein QF719_06590 [Chloroflexota bacterium]|jgi:hypothetical protein|nr:hypothetical protein [Chloroflexota bacterium]MDP6508199.1 hypothetical protein [Chloroflexota bacterium]MDP6757865.1 hypothetical protein [Chloroflexota bacterium]